MCIIDHKVQSLSLCASALFLLFLYLISQHLFVCVSFLFFFQAFVQFAAVLINGKMSKVALKERCTCV